MACISGWHRYDGARRVHIAIPASTRIPPSRILRNRPPVVKNSDRSSWTQSATDRLRRGSAQRSLVDARPGMPGPHYVLETADAEEGV